MLPLNLADTTPEHIQDYIESEVAESLTLDYKEAWPGAGTDDKREFLYDVAAFANEAGGDLIFGLADRRGDDKQSTGIADKIAGIKVPNPQTEIARLSNLIKDCIAPRLAGVVMQPVSCPDGDVLVVRIPHSWARPHMVTINGVNKFVRRAPTGKYPMSVDEIRRAFSEQRELGESIERWREHRADLAATNKGPVAFASHVKLLVHIIPASAFSREPLRESWSISEQEKYRIYVPHTATSHRYNADGYLAVAQIGPNSAADAYVQLFRSGIMEYADCRIFFPPTHGVPEMILGQEVEKQIVRCYEDAILRMRRQGRTGIAYVGVSLIGIADKKIHSFAGRWGILDHAIRDDIFTSPEVLVDISDVEESPYRKTLLPLVDTMWQAGGWEGSPNKPGGQWNPFVDRY